MWKNIHINKVVVLLTNGADEIFVHTAHPSTFPDYIPDENMVMKIEAAANYGVQYVRDHFNMEPEVVNVKIK